MEVDLHLSFVVFVGPERRVRFDVHVALVLVGLDVSFGQGWKARFLSSELLRCLGYVTGDRRVDTTKALLHDLVEEIEARHGKVETSTESRGRVRNLQRSHSARKQRSARTPTEVSDRRSVSKPPDCTSAWSCRLAIITGLNADDDIGDSWLVAIDDWICPSKLTVNRGYRSRSMAVFILYASRIDDM